MQTGMPVVLAAGGDDTPELATGQPGPAPLVQVGRLFGYRIAAYPARNLDELRRMIRFIGTVGRLPSFETEPVLVHVSVNGDTDGMGVGRDRAPWEQFASMIVETTQRLKTGPRPVTLALSAPGANADQLADLVSRHGNPETCPLDHMFLFVDRPRRATDAIFAWTHFYGEATEMDFTADSVEDHPNAQRLRIRMRRLGMGDLRYFPRVSAADACVAPATAGAPFRMHGARTKTRATGIRPGW